VVLSATTELLLWIRTMDRQKKRKALDRSTGGAAKDEKRY